MRCSQCGMPLSPSRTHCPRCGHAAGEADKRVERADPAPDAPFFPVGGFPSGGNGSYEGAEFSQGQWNGAPPPWATQMDPRNPGAAPMQQLSFPGNNDATTTAPFYVQSPAQQDPRFASSMPPAGGWSAPAAFNPLANNLQTARPFPQPPTSARNKKSTRTGFTIASLCLIAGALLLVFIYVLSQSSVGSPAVQGPVASNTQSATPATTGNASATSTSTTKATATPTSTTPTPLPAQKYIVQAEMASSIDEHTAIPSVLGTNFHVQQKTYLAMTVNPQGQSGAVCLQWYINSQHLPGYDFSFVINPNAQRAFSYIFPSTTGPAYVEIYWASTEKCTDQVLAQRVDFTISA